MEEMQGIDFHHEHTRNKDIEPIAENSLDKSDITMEDNNKAQRQSKKREEHKMEPKINLP
jgi:hypothetical protein